MGKYENEMGEAIEAATQAMFRYVRAYKRVHGGDVGEDAIIGDEGVKRVLQGLDTMLNGERGKYDGGAQWRGIHDVAREAGMLDKNGEL